LWRRIDRWAEAQNLIFDEHEIVVLTEACGVADRLAQLGEALAGWDSSDPASVRLLTEERLQRGALANLLVSKLGLPTGVVATEPVKGTTPRSRRAQTAAQARWNAS
jgi:hypothetical protein